MPILFLFVGCPEVVASSFLGSPEIDATDATCDTID